MQFSTLGTTLPLSLCQHKYLCDLLINQTAGLFWVKLNLLSYISFTGISSTRQFLAQTLDKGRSMETGQLLL